MVDPTRARGDVRARAALVLAALAAGGAFAVTTLVQGVRFRVPLSLLGGVWFQVGLAATLAAAMAACLSGLRLARAWTRGEPRGSWLAIRALFASAVLCGAAFLLTVPAFGTPWFRLFACGFFGLWAWFTVLEDRIVPAAPRLVRALDVLLFDLALVLLLLEGSLSVVARVRPSQLLATVDAGAEAVLAQFRQPAGKPRLGFPLNRGGHYDEEFTTKEDGERERLVACIGDSFSLGTVPHHWHYTTVCERLLPGTRVDNFGVPGIGPPEYGLLLRDEALPLQPDLAVIALFVGNDIAFLGSRSEPRGGVLRRWLDRAHSRTWALIGHLLRIRAEEEAAGGAGTALIGDASAPSDGVRNDDPAQLERTLPWLHEPALEPPGWSEKAFLACERSRAADVCQGDRDSYAPLFRELQRILELAGDTPLGFLLIPDQFQVDDDVWQSVEASLGTSDLERDRAQRWIGEWLSQRGVPYVDLLPRMRAVPVLPDGSRHLYLLRNTHFNVRGNEVAAEGLAELIREVLR